MLTSAPAVAGGAHGTLITQCSCGRGRGRAFGARRPALRLRASKDDSNSVSSTSDARVTTSTSSSGSKDYDVDRPDLGVGLKAVWFGAEFFGDALARVKGAVGQGKQSARDNAGQPMSREAIVAGIRADYDTNYFISGEGEMAAYAPDCVFSDPFVSFKGVDRFKKNVANLGAVISDVQLDVTDWQERGDEVEASWRFSATLDLPWRPRLAAAGSTTHVIDPQLGRVVAHVERWKGDPGKIVASLLKPASKIPQNQWETFFSAASDGDAKGMWLAITPKTLQLCAPAFGVLFVLGLLLQDGAPGAGTVHTLEWTAGILATSAGLTEVAKFVFPNVGT